MDLKKVFDGVRSGALDVMFPVYCIECGVEEPRGTLPAGKYICTECSLFMSEFQSVCSSCDSYSFTGERHVECSDPYSFDGVINVWQNEGVIRKLMSRVKDDGLTHAIDEIVERSFSLMAAQPDRSGPFLSFLLRCDAITYVPLWGKRRNFKGYDQAELLARSIGKALDKDVKALLMRTRETEPQNSEIMARRYMNVKGAFKAKEEAPSSVLLVDDVWQSGATMKDCCYTLKKARVKEVWGLTITRTP